MTSSKNASVTSLLKLIHILGYAGLIPFVIPVGLMCAKFWFGFGTANNGSMVFYAPYLFTSYSAIILSFMAGTLWANWYLVEKQNLAKVAILVSNLLALTAFSALLLMYVSVLPQILCVIILGLGFVSLLWVERIIGVQVKAYWRMRLSLTILVVILHFLMMIILFMEF